MKVKYGLVSRCYSCGIPNKTANRSRTSPSERSVFQSTQLKEVGDLKSILTSDMEIQNLECVKLVFRLALVHYFLTILPFLHFGMVMYILVHYMLEVCNLLSYFDL